MLCSEREGLFTREVMPRASGVGVAMEIRDEEDEGFWNGGG